MSDENQNSDPSDDSDSSVAMKAAANKKRKKTPSTGKTKKRKKGGFEKGVSMIDDAAVLSGEESSDDDDEDGEENVNDYVRDGFVVDEQEQEQEQEEEKKKAEDGLEDSDDDDNGDGDDDDDDSVGGKRRPKGIRKMRDTDRLDDDDMDLINEARGITGKRQEVDNQEEKKRNRIKAKNTADLRKGLFDASDDEGATTNKGASAGGRRQGQRQVETFDEDGMDDFIEYDENMPRDRYRDDEDNMIGNKGISEAQLNEANDIFGTDFADFMAGDNNDEEDFDEDYADGDQRSGSRRSYRERGVGVDMGMDSDEFADESSDDDIFASDDDEANSGLTAEQRAEALRLKKEKRQLKKDERRKAAAKKKSDKRKANLRRAFEPVQLVENFCTERDDEIRSKDVPERFFDWSTPFHGPAGLVKEFSLVEEEEAEWIIGRIPAIQTEHDSIIADFSDDVKMDNDGMDEMEKKQRNIVTSIIQALRYMHREKLEPDFIRKYREDYVISPAVRANLYAVMDEDTEWERVLNAKTKVNALLEELLKIAESDDALGADEDNVAKLKEDLMLAQERLDESVQQELNIKNDIGALDNDEDDDDDLFGDDDEEDKEKVSILWENDMSFLAVRIIDA
jgi:transcription elongation factor SPT6